MENEKCPFCGCGAIYEIERNDDLIGTYPQLFCNGCKMIFETENNSPHLKDKETYDYLREKNMENMEHPHTPRKYHSAPLQSR